MKYVDYGKTGRRVSVVGFGGMRFDQKGRSDEENAEVVRYACAQGVNYFDTAPGYGRSEDIFGIAFKDMPGDYWVSTKAMPTSYETAAEIEGPLQYDARESQAICEALAEAAAIGSEQAPIPEEGDPVGAPAARESVVALFDRRAALLEALLGDAEGTHYAFVIREEIERADMGRARFLRDTRRLYVDGDVRALAALQQLVTSHRESKNANRHLLALADLYAELAVDYVESHPPETLRFDPPRFEELVEAAARLYEAITNQDGAPEKLEAARRLEAFLAFTLKVDRDRFSP